ncbi:hypothetical protein Tco_0057816 [Tanacetum coccineum]
MPVGTRWAGVLGGYTVAGGRTGRGVALAFSSSAFRFARSKDQNTCSDEDTKVPIPGIERPWLSEAEGFTLPNHDTVNHSHRKYLGMGRGMGRHAQVAPGFLLGGKSGVWGGWQFWPLSSYNHIAKLRPEHYYSRRLNDGIIMLELIAYCIPSWFSEVQLCLVAFNADLKEDDRDDLAEEADSVLHLELNGSNEIWMKALTLHKACPLIMTCVREVLFTCRQYHFMKVVMSLVFASKEFSAGVSLVKTNVDT